jgi:hypothetical protein
LGGQPLGHKKGAEITQKRMDLRQKKITRWSPPSYCLVWYLEAWDERQNQVPRCCMPGSRWHKVDAPPPLRIMPPPRSSEVSRHANEAMVLTGNVAAPSRALKEEIGEGEMLDKSTDDWKQCCQRRRLVGGYTKRCPCHENSVAYFSKTRPTIFTKLGTML